MKSSIVTKDGIVVRLENWVQGKIETECVLSISRVSGTFYVDIRSNEHGGKSVRVKKLEEALTSLHPEIAEEILAAFQMEKATEEYLKKLFPYHEVIMN